MSPRVRCNAALGPLHSSDKQARLWFKVLQEYLPFGSEVTVDGVPPMASPLDCMSTCCSRKTMSERSPSQRISLVLQELQNAVASGQMRCTDCNEQVFFLPF